MNGANAIVIFLNEDIKKFCNVLTALAMGFCLKTVFKPTVVAITIVISEVETILEILEIELLITFKPPVRMLIAPAIAPPKDSVSPTAISNPALLNLANASITLFTELVAPPNSCNKTLPTLGKISSESTPPFDTISTIAGILNPIAFAKTDMAGGNFSLSCWRNSSILTRPLANICVYAMNTRLCS